MKDDAQDPTPTRRWVRPAAVAAALFALLAWPLILSGYVRGRGAHDQLNYHEQAIRTFAEQWPAIDYSDYLSATTPGYHTLLAAAARFLTDDRRALQLIASLFTIALIFLAARAVAPSRTRPGGPSTIALLLPLVASMPVFYAGVWLLPDNAGWLGVLAVWMLALRPRSDGRTLLGGAVLLAALVFVRQIHIWPLALLLTAAWLGPTGAGTRDFDFAQDLRDLFTRPARRAGRALLALLAGVPALAVLAYFWWLWGGLTPPVFHERHVGGNPTAPAFVLAVFCMLSPFFLPYVLEGLRLLWVRHTWLLALAVLVGLVAALAAPSTYSFYDGRYSGLWNVARRLPAPGDRSVLISAMAVAGAVLVAAWFVVLDRRDRWVMLAALVAFTAAQCASYQLWQRYNEPFVLLWLILAASRTPAPATAPAAAWRVIGPALLAAGFAAMTTASIVLARPVMPRELIAPWEREAPFLPGMRPRPPRED